MLKGKCAILLSTLFIYSIKATFSLELNDFVYCQIHQDGVVSVNSLITLLKGNQPNRTCSYVDGFVRVMFESTSSKEDVDELVKLLNNVQVITGYLFIRVFQNYKIHQITMKNLRTINGQVLHEGFSLSVQNSDGNFKKVSFPKLNLISKGNVGFFYNSGLCKSTIYWPEILNDTTVQTVNDQGLTNCQDEPTCHPNCPTMKNTQQSFCHGPNRDQCQDASRCKVRQTCLHCFQFNGSEECCDHQCAGGCSGSSPKDCFSCANKWYNGECVPFCPTNSFHLSDLCLSECPVGYLTADNYCVESCGPGFVIKNKTCIKCTGHECFQSCNLTDEEGKHISLKKEHLPSLVNCTHLYGSIIIDYSSFASKIQNANDFLALSSLTWIQGNIMMDFKSASPNILNDPRMESLFFLKNLQVVVGTSSGKNDNFRSYFVNMPIKYFGLTSLRSIESKTLVISNCIKLRYAAAVKWKKLGVKNVTIKNDSQTLDSCDSECHVEWGCWGPGALQCVKCAHWQLTFDDNRCVGNCEEWGNYYNPSSNSSNVQCGTCHHECDAGCHGAGPFQCKKCKNFKIVETGECVSKGHVLVIEKMIVNQTEIARVKEILPNGSLCPRGYYSELVNPHNIANLEPEVAKFVIKTDLSLICRQCASPCGICTSLTECHFCDGQWQKSGVCVKNCDFEKLPLDYKQVEFRANESCPSCHKLCVGGCKNTNESTCEKCVGDFVLNANGVATCVESCPDGLSRESNGLCAKPSIVSSATSSLFMLCVIVTGSIVICVVLLIYILIQKSVVHQKLLLKNLYTNGLFIGENIENNSERTPNLNRLEIVNVNDLEYSREHSSRLGHGAFGEVFRGKWKLTESQRKRREEELPSVQLPTSFSNVLNGKKYLEMDVAIKFLSKASFENLEEFFSEAKVMASVKHPYCLPLIGVCLSEDHRSLITAYMPLGSMNHYLHNTPAHQLAASKLLLWSYQIADGMNYLSQQGIIHRDLATRNVLLKDSQWAMITDFGLSTMLEKENDKEIVIKSGSVPIRWLAEETIRLRVYSEKSDVWAFGVTLWEIFTYGSLPYKELRNPQIAQHILKGFRLECPTGCKSPLYQLMMSCWHKDPECRPTFKNLEEQLKKYLDNPADYFIPPTSAPVELRGKFRRGIKSNISSEKKTPESEYLDMVSQFGRESELMSSSPISLSDFNSNINSRYIPMQLSDFSFSPDHGTSGKFFP